MRYAFILLLFAGCTQTRCDTRPAWLPDDTLTPGQVSPGWTLADTMAAGGTQNHRHVPESLKEEVWHRYGYDKSIGPYIDHSGEYEIDHRVMQALGGASTVENLWPQPYQGEWGARTKDKLELHVRSLVVEGKLSIHDGQQVFMGDWTKAYKHFSLDDVQ